MSNTTMFHSSKESLPYLLHDIGAGRIQLPDFQRGWIWDDEHIKDLLVSISLSYPIGSVMTLSTTDAKVRFKPRLIEGVSLQRPPEPQSLILDGQQRLTSLFQALYSKQVVETRDSRGKPIKRWYYVNLQKLLMPNIDREDMIVSVAANRVQRNFRGEIISDDSTREQEIASGLFPLNLVFDTNEQLNWQMQYLQGDPSQLAERLAHWKALNQEFILPIQQYQIPLIQLGSNTPKEAVCQVFEKVNTGGVQLTVFELLTATYAADGYTLRQDWEQRQKQFRAYKAKALAAVENTDFLQAVTLPASYTQKRAGKDTAVSCKRKDILNLKLEEYRLFAEQAAQGFKQAARFLYEQCIFSERDLPYHTQLVPLAVIFAVLGASAYTAGALNKLRRWYWCGVFGELYGSAVETQFARDVPEVVEWVENNTSAVPSIVERATFTPGRLQTLQTRNSAAYKGLYAILLSEGVRDFRSNTKIDHMTFFDEKIDIHHIFPQAWCKQHGIEARRCDSIINKTAISASTNRIIGGKAPSIYLQKLQNPSKSDKVDAPSMDAILLGHAIEPRYLRADDFDGFFKAREAALLTFIERAMGKPIAREVQQEDSIEEVSEYQEEEELEEVN